MLSSFKQSRLTATVRIAPDRVSRPMLACAKGQKATNTL